MFEILTYGLRAAKKAGRAALVTILLIKAIIREDGTLRIALVRVFFSTTSGTQFRTMVGRHSAISLEVLDCRNGKGARSKLWKATRRARADEVLTSWKNDS